MKLTVGILKRILKGLDDDIILAHLEAGNTKFSPFTQTKSVFLLKADDNWDNKTYLTINELGSCFTGDGEQRGLIFAQRQWDENTLKLNEQK